MPGKSDTHDVQMDRDNGGKRRLTCYSCDPAGMCFVVDQPAYSDAGFRQMVAKFLQAHPIGAFIRHMDLRQNIPAKDMWKRW